MSAINSSTGRSKEQDVRRTKESDLLLAVMTYVSRCVAEGDYRALADIGFEIDDVVILEDLSITDMHSWSTARCSGVVVSVDRDVLQRQVDTVRARRARARLESQLLQAGAPQSMMLSLFRMSQRIYAMRRAAVGAEPSNGGRPREATEAEQAMLWDLYVVLARTDRPERLRSDDAWLLIARAWPPGLRIAWSCIQRWAHDPQHQRAFLDERRQIGDANAIEREAQLRLKFGLPDHGGI